MASVDSYDDKMVRLCNWKSFKTFQFWTHTLRGGVQAHIPLLEKTVSDIGLILTA